LKKLNRDYSDPYIIDYVLKSDNVKWVEEIIEIYKNQGLELPEDISDDMEEQSERRLKLPE